MAALVAGKILGARPGRFFEEETGKKHKHPKVFQPNSPALQALGTWLFWIGSYGYCFANFADNVPAAALAAVNVTLAGAAAAFASLVLDAILSSMASGDIEYHLTFALKGTETGLVAIAAGAPVVEPWAALIIGVLAGGIHVGAHRLVEEFKFFRVDDVVDAVAVHAYGGMWGLISVAIFAEGSLLVQAGYSDEVVGIVYDFPKLLPLLCQIAGVAFIMGWVGFNMAFFCYGLNFLGVLRHEMEIDQAKHDEEEEEEDDDDNGGEKDEDDDENDNHETNEDQDPPNRAKEPPTADVDEEAATEKSLKEALKKRNEKLSKRRPKKKEG